MTIYPQYVNIFPFWLTRFVAGRIYALFVVKSTSVPKLGGGGGGVDSLKLRRILANWVVQKIKWEQYHRCQNAYKQNVTFVQISTQTNIHICSPKKCTYNDLVDQEWRCYVVGQQSYQLVGSWLQKHFIIHLLHSLDFDTNEYPNTFPPKNARIMMWWTKNKGVI